MEQLQAIAIDLEMYKIEYYLGGDWNFLKLLLIKKIMAYGVLYFFFSHVFTFWAQTVVLAQNELKLLLL